MTTQRDTTSVPLARSVPTRAERRRTAPVLRVAEARPLVEDDAFTGDELATLEELVNTGRLIALVQSRLIAKYGHCDMMADWILRGAFPVRLSKKDYTNDGNGKSVNGHTNQLNSAANFCVINEVLPVFVLLETKSAYGKKDPRTALNAMFDAISYNELVVDLVAPLRADRLARNEVIGMALATRLRYHERGGEICPIGLHETSDPERIRPLANMEEWDHWSTELVKARQSSDITKRRIDEHFAGKAGVLELVSPIDRVFGYQPIYASRVVKVNGVPTVQDYQAQGALDPVENPHLLDAITRLLDGTDSAPQICKANNEAAIPWCDGEWTTVKLWPAVTHPRLEGLQTCGHTDDGHETPILVPAPIPAIITSEQRQRLIRLREASRLNPGVKAWSRNLMSAGVAICGVCDANLHRAGDYYACPNAGVGGLHPAPKASILENFAKQAALLAHRERHTAEMERLAAEGAPVATDERVVLEARLADLQRQSGMVAGQVRRQELTAEQGEAAYSELRAEREPVDARIAELAAQSVPRQRFSASPHKARETMETGTVSEQRRLVRSVISHVVVNVADDKQRNHQHERSMDVVFCPDVHTTPESLASLATDLLALRKRKRKETMPDCKGVSLLAEDTMVELWQKGRTNPQIADELNRRDIATARGQSEWYTALVVPALRRVCGERGLEYRANTKQVYTPKVMDLAYKMVVREGRTHKAVAEMLQIMREPSPSGNGWTPRMVGWLVRAAQEARGEAVATAPSRPTTLAFELLVQMDDLLTNGMSAPDVGRWLSKDLGLRSTTGKEYDGSMVRRQVKQHRDALAKLA